MKKRRRFTPEFKAKVVLDVLTGAQSPAEACRKHTLSPQPRRAEPRWVFPSMATDFNGDGPRGTGIKP